MGTEGSLSVYPIHPGPWPSSKGWTQGCQATIRALGVQLCPDRATSGMAFSRVTQDWKNWPPQPDSQETDLWQKVSSIIYSQKVLSLIWKPTQETK